MTHAKASKSHLIKNVIINVVSERLTEVGRKKLSRGVFLECEYLDPFFHFQRVLFCMKWVRKFYPRDLLDRKVLYLKGFVIVKMAQSNDHEPVFAEYVY